MVAASEGTYSRLEHAGQGEATAGAGSAAVVAAVRCPLYPRASVATFSATVAAVPSHAVITVALAHSLGLSGVSRMRDYRGGLRAMSSSRTAAVMCFKGSGASVGHLIPRAEEQMPSEIGR